jgi:hypothetical protein
LITTARIVSTDEGGSTVVLAAEVMPGQWADELWEMGVKQTALLTTRAVAFDPYRQQAEKRLAKYLCFYYRWNAIRVHQVLSLRVGTILANSGIEPSRRNPQRTRTRLENALNLLVVEGVMSKWRYKGEKKLPARDWFSQWQQWIVEVHAPTDVVTAYRSIARKRKEKKKKIAMENPECYVIVHVASGLGLF